MPIELQKVQTHKKEQKKGGEESSLIRKIEKVLTADIQFGSGMKDKKKERFFSELSVLLSSGIDIKTSLEIIVDEQTKKQDKELFETLYNRVIHGQSLSESLEETGKFTTYDYYTLRIGEETGRVSHVLNDLTMYYEKKIAQKRQLTSAFSYPILVLITAFAAVFFMMNYMVPMFKDIFMRTNAELPGLTKFIIKASNAFSSNIGTFLFILVIIGIVVYSIRKKDYYRDFITRLTLKLPLIGRMVRMSYLSRFFQSASLLISSSIPMLRTIQLCRKMIRYYPFEKAMATIEDDIMHGKPLHQSMQKFSIFDTRTTSLVKVGEEVNQLHAMFDRLHKQYSKELEHQTSMLGNVLEPLLIIFVGVLVAVILVAMYLPMFQMGTAIY
jgi:type IV pilus assembly protein PilC